MLQSRHSNCKPHLACSPQMGLRGQRYSGFGWVGNMVFVLEMDRLGVGVFGVQFGDLDAEL